MMEVPLTRGLVALVDDEDYEALAAFRWTARPYAQSRQNWMAFRTIHKEGRTSSIYMHRQVLQAPTGLEVDHRDGNGLNNTRANLRLCTKSQNNANRLHQNATGFRGVYAQKRRWRAIIECKGIAYRLGFFPNPVDAARAYDAAARDLFGEFAILNFPQAEATS